MKFFFSPPTDEMLCIWMNNVPDRGIINQGLLQIFVVSCCSTNIDVTGVPCPFCSFCPFQVTGPRFFSLLCVFRFVT